MTDAQEQIDAAQKYCNIFQCTLKSSMVLYTPPGFVVARRSLNSVKSAGLKIMCSPACPMATSEMEWHSTWDALLSSKKQDVRAQAIWALKCSKAMKKLANAAPAVRLFGKANGPTLASRT